MLPEVQKPGRLRRARRLGARAGIAALLTIIAAGLIISTGVSARGDGGTWPGGVVTIYDAADSTGATIATAAERWTASGAGVTFRLVAHPQQADVVVSTDDRRLIGLCGTYCLGYTTSVGRPRGGHSEVILRSDLSGPSRPLSIWVATHELGHVLGLKHRDDNTLCTVMSAHVSDNACAPSRSAPRPTAEDLACIPAPADVDAAVRLYGGTALPRDPRCK